MNVYSVWRDLGSLVPPVGRSVQEEYGVREAVHGLSQIDLRAQELKDMEVARRLQEEELMVRNTCIEIEHFRFPQFSYINVSPFCRRVNLTNELLKLHKTRLEGVFTS